MINLIAATWKLSLYQVWNRKRRWITVALMLFPVVIVGVAAILGTPEKADFYENFYQKFVTVALGSILIPFVALFWGTGALTDEIEGKTLVYLWTRPRHRGFLIFCKVVGSWLWLIIMAFLGVGAVYLYAYYNAPAGGLAENLPVLLWDWRALALAAIAFSSLGFLLSVLTKRPLVYGLLIAYMWELIPEYGPGFFQRISITQQMQALATHKEEKEASFAQKLIEQVPITEVEALITLLVIIIVCVAGGIWMAGQREFLSDDPARNQ